MVFTSRVVIAGCVRILERLGVFRSLRIHCIGCNPVYICQEPHVLEIKVFGNSHIQPGKYPEYGIPDQNAESIKYSIVNVNCMKPAFEQE